MKKYIWALMVPAICLGLDEVASGLGFAESISCDPSAAIVTIDKSVTTDVQQKHETFKCKQLNIASSGHLHVTNTMDISDAVAVFLVDEDIVINGAITAADNVKIQLFSKNIMLNEAKLHAPICDFIADEINIIASKISSQDLFIDSQNGNINFDIHSTITCPDLRGNINFAGKNIVASGKINAIIGNIYFEVDERLDITNLEAETKRDAFDEKIDYGLHIIFNNSDCTIGGPTTDVNAAASGSGEAAFLAQNVIAVDCILKWLQSTPMTIKTSKNIKVTQMVNNHLDANMCLLSLDALVVDILEPVYGIDLFFIYSNVQAGKGTINFGDCASSAEVSNLISPKKLALFNVNLNAIVDLASAETIDVAQSKVTIAASNNIKEITSLNSEIFIKNILPGFILEFYRLIYFANHLDPLFRYAKSVTFDDVKLDSTQMLSLPCATYLGAYNSEVYLLALDNINHIVNDNSNINVAQISSKTYLKDYEIQNTVNPKDPLLAIAKSVAIVKVNSDKYLFLPHAQRLVLLDSTVSLLSPASITELNCDNSCIKSVRVIPQDYELFKYTIANSVSGHIFRSKFVSFENVNIDFEHPKTIDTKLSFGIVLLKNSNLKFEQKLNATKIILKDGATIRGKYKHSAVIEE